MPTKSKKKKPKTSGSLYSKALSVFQRAPNKQFSYKLLSKKLGKKADYEEIKSVVDKLISRGLVEKTDKRLRLVAREDASQEAFTEQTAMITGKVDMALRGSAYVISDQSTEDVYISSKNLNHALDGDIVKVLIKFVNKRSKKPEGEIVEVVKRSIDKFIGTVKISKDFAFVIPDKKNMSTDIFIPLDKLHGAKDGDKVIAQFIEWPTKAKSPIGKVIELLTNLSINDLAMNTILVDYGINFKFSEKQLEEANQIPSNITDEEIKKRKDFRNVTTFTIDPKDAKDFDDAISINKIDEDTFEIGIHIADVSHYIQPNTLLDKEALKRGNSIYLVDRVIPMFPEKLSNELCSLRPNEDKLCYAAVFHLHKNGKVLKEWFGRTIIHSDKRFVYEEAQEVINAGTGKYFDELTILNNIAHKLRAQRFKEGSIAFETSEVSFVLDPTGKPIGLTKKERLDTHMLVEDYMLLANRSIAKVINKAKPSRPMVYRIHDEPDIEKLLELAHIAKEFGHRVDVSTPKKIPDALNNLMAAVKGKPEQDLLEKLAIRTMAKAVYSTDNVGHYGLGFEFYTHFTSPIRRYADVLVHRRTTEFLSKSQSIADKEALEKQCNHISDMERKAMEAERASVKYKQVEYMQAHVGETFDGIISGVTDWGIFVELIENKCEGMIRLNTIEHDTYTFNAATKTVTGSISGDKLRLGDKLKVKVIKADLVNANLDFQLVQD